MQALDISNSLNGAKFSSKTDLRDWNVKIVDTATGIGDYDQRNYISMTIVTIFHTTYIYISYEFLYLRDERIHLPAMNRGSQAISSADKARLTSTEQAHGRSPIESLASWGRSNLSKSSKLLGPLGMPGKSWLDLSWSIHFGGPTLEQLCWSRFPLSLAMTKVKIEGHLVSLTTLGPAFSNHSSPGMGGNLDDGPRFSRLAPGLLVVSFEESFYGTAKSGGSSHAAFFSAVQQAATEFQGVLAQKVAPERVKCEIQNCYRWSTLPKILASLGPLAPPTIPSMIWLKLLDEKL